jgi:hypothetical protein
VILEHQAFAWGCLQLPLLKTQAPLREMLMYLEFLETFHFKQIADFPVGAEPSKYAL